MRYMEPGVEVKMEQKTKIPHSIIQGNDKHDEEGGSGESSNELPKPLLDKFSEEISAYIGLKIQRLIEQGNFRVGDGGQREVPPIDMMRLTQEAYNQVVEEYNTNPAKTLETFNYIKNCIKELNQIVTTSPVLRGPNLFDFNSQVAALERPLKVSSAQNIEDRHRFKRDITDNTNRLEELRNQLTNNLFSPDNIQMKRDIFYVIACYTISTLLLPLPIPYFVYMLSAGALPGLAAAMTAFTFTGFVVAFFLLCSELKGVYNEYRKYKDTKREISNAERNIDIAKTGLTNIEHEIRQNTTPIHPDASGIGRLHDLVTGYNDGLSSNNPSVEPSEYMKGLYETLNALRVGPVLNHVSGGEVFNGEYVPQDYPNIDKLIRHPYYWQLWYALEKINMEKGSEPSFDKLGGIIATLNQASEGDLELINNSLKGQNIQDFAVMLASKNEPMDLEEIAGLLKSKHEEISLIKSHKIPDSNSNNLYISQREDFQRSKSYGDKEGEEQDKAVGPLFGGKNLSGLPYFNSELQSFNSI